MLVKTKDDQQYGIIKGTVKQGKLVAYTVQCYGHLPRVGPWIRKCTLMRTYSQPTSLLQVHSIVLIGYNYQDTKTGAIAYVYAGASELSQLIQNAQEYEVPDKLVQKIEQQLEGGGDMDDNN